MIITGNNFGNQRNTSSYVKVGESVITSSGYRSWTNNQIKILLPSNVQDGLVVVVTKAGKSKPGFFANEVGIPVEVPPDTKTSMPVITSVSPETATPGTLLCLNGTNFGTIRNNAKVWFTAAYDEQSQTEDSSLIAASEDNFDYEYWSDSEIHIRIPDGASSGQVFVETQKGKSNFSYLEIKSPAGKKSFSGKKTYLIQLNVDIENINSRSNTTLNLRVPHPPVTASQPVAELSEVSPEPVFSHYQNTSIHQLEFAKAGTKKIRFNHSYVLEEYSVTTEINPKAVKPFLETGRVLYKTFTEPDELIKSDDDDFTALASSIVKRETNPYFKAKLIYSWMLENYTLLPDLRKTGSPAKDLVTKKIGDAYDFAVIYTTLLRSCNIPAVPVCGILVDSELKSRNHWWTQFYLENFGWVPVDISLAAGLDYKPFKPLENPAEFYFGNLDSQHITFSTGYNDLKTSLANSHTVSRERTYSLQSIWEESSTGTVNYSSLWNDPVVVGIY